MRDAIQYFTNMVLTEFHNSDYVASVKEIVEEDNTTKIVVEYEYAGLPQYKTGRVSTLSTYAFVVSPSEQGYKAVFLNSERDDEFYEGE